jgi:amidase
MFGTYIRKYYDGSYYGKAMNITRRLTAAYDVALATHDLLLMPTTPMKVTPLPPNDALRELYIERP